MSFPASNGVSKLLGKEEHLLTLINHLELNGQENFVLRIKKNKIYSLLDYILFVFVEHIVNDEFSHCF